MPSPRRPGFSRWLRIVLKHLTRPFIEGNTKGGMVDFSRARIRIHGVFVSVFLKFALGYAGAAIATAQDREAPAQSEHRRGEGTSGWLVVRQRSLRAGPPEGHQHCAGAASYWRHALGKCHCNCPDRRGSGDFCCCHSTAEAAVRGAPTAQIVESKMQRSKTVATVRRISKLFVRFCATQGPCN